MMRHKGEELRRNAFIKACLPSFLTEYASPFTEAVKQHTGKRIRKP